MQVQGYTDLLEAARLVLKQATALHPEMSTLSYLRAAIASATGESKAPGWEDDLRAAEYDDSGFGDDPLTLTAEEASRLAAQISA